MKIKSCLRISTKRIGLASRTMVSFKSGKINKQARLPRPINSMRSHQIRIWSTIVSGTSNTSSWSVFSQSISKNRRPSVHMVRPMYWRNTSHWSWIKSTLWQFLKALWCLRLHILRLIPWVPSIVPLCPQSSLLVSTLRESQKSGSIITTVKTRRRRSSRQKFGKNMRGKSARTSGWSFRSLSRD
jgi:hypothetical protein